MIQKDKSILWHMIKYCTEVSETITIMGLDFEKFAASHIARNSISMCILQIGELARKLSDDIKKKYTEIPWQSAISMRNRAAHGYYTMDIATIWNTACIDAPILKSYCEKILEEIDNERP